MPDERPTAAIKRTVDHLEQAREARALVDQLGDDAAEDPIRFAGRNVGGTQRTYLLAAAVDALIDIATTLRAIKVELYLTRKGDTETGPRPLEVR